MDETNTKDKIVENLKEKSLEAFLLAIEIYNKPTIQYRLEGFAFFLCNAWELLLKAHIISKNDNEAIYYKDKPERTIALSDCVKKVFTNDKDPIRINLEILIELRNTSTHFVIKELETFYTPFLQASVLNYSQKMFDFLSYDISKKISSSFMTLVTNTEMVSDTEVLSKYGENVFLKYQKLSNENAKILTENVNDKLAININLNVKIVRTDEEAKINFRIAKDGEDPAIVLRETRDVNSCYPYSQRTARESIEKILAKKGIKVPVSQYSFGLICKKFNLLNNSDYFYYHEISKRRTCSHKIVTFVSDLIYSDKDIIEKLKNDNKKNN